MNQPRYYAGEFEDDGRKLHAAFLVLLLLLIASLLFYCAFWAGGVLERERAAEEARLIAKATRGAGRADWSQFNCRELVNICKKREASR